jgi:alkylation response protein AidB-like acyl-CoA dehydrogenase
MTDTAELDLLRDSVRGALSGFPEALGLGRGDDLAPGAAAAAMGIATAQGWTAMLLPEALGGLGLGFRHAVVVAEEVGRTLTPGPLLANAVLLPALAAAAQADWLNDLASSVGAGEETVAICFSGDPNGAAGRRFVEHGAEATVIVSLTRVGEGESPSSLVRRLDSPRLTPRRCLDPTCSLAELEGPESVRDGEGCRLSPGATADVLGAAQLWIAAELLGVAERAGAMSIAHATTRRQFGAPIGANQAVKHRIADDYVLRRNAAVVLADAAAAWDSLDDDRLLLAHAARASATAAAYSATAHCIQVHGALGFSAESGIHLAYKRARRLGCAFGDDAASRAFVAARLVAKTAA